MAKEYVYDYFFNEQLMLYLSHSLRSVFAQSNSIFVPINEDAMKLVDFMQEFPN